MKKDVNSLLDVTDKEKEQQGSQGRIGESTGKEIYPWFPLFISLENKKAVVFGGGKIAKRRILSLQPFGAAIKVIAPEIHEELLRNESLSIIQREYRNGDCCGADLVIAATDKTAVNHEIAEECRVLGIPVSVADSKELCTFYFLGIVRKDNLVIGLTASGEDHEGVKRAVQKLQLHIDEILK
ncbi:MAG TPA: NAD(P)-dependent oxidoreductase [Negativicutes bacterium]|nr:NAD(P)-dependent oxidoreductase [Negativicutes bacterium]